MFFFLYPAHELQKLLAVSEKFKNQFGHLPCCSSRQFWGCTGFDWYDSGYRLQVERSSPDWAKNLTANNSSYDYALAA